MPVQNRLPADAPARRQLHDEVHARPVPRIRVPALVTHLAVLNHGVSAEDERAHLCDLIEGCDRAFDRSDPMFLQVSLPEFTIRWERHGEFSGYTITQPLDPRAVEAAHDPDLLAMLPVPAQWLAGVPGQTLVATQLLMLPPNHEPAEQAAQTAARLLGSGWLTGSSVKDGSAQLYTCYQLREDGTSRFLVRCDDVTEGRTGRIAVSLLELETYRVLALRAFRPARALAATLPAVDSRLAELTQALQQTGGPEQADEDLLHELIQLAAEIETDLATHSTLFGSAQAYFDIVQQRIDDLRGTALPGLMGVFTFLRRRMLPAMATVTSTAERLAELSQRVDRTGDLLRTRVDITTERQNQELLRSLDRGQRVQLRLQETVEGLSVAAITYYLVGLFGYAGKALKAAGVHVAGAPVNPDLVTGLAVPVAVAGVWLTLRRVKRRLHS
jgi:uncharacterized membrane-anchored protein